MKERPQDRCRVRFETLEDRLLLSADLIGIPHFDIDSETLIPGDRVQGTVVVRNIGDAKTWRSARVDLYASRDEVFDPSDVLLDSEYTDSRIRSGRSDSETFRFSLPATLQPGDYSLLAVVDSRNAVKEKSEANNVSVGAGFTLAWMFGEVPDQCSAETLSIRDADGTRVRFSLAGPGTGEVTIDDGEWDLRLTGTDATSVLSILTSGGGDRRVSLDDIHVTGSLGGLLAPTLDLTGTLAVEGRLKAGLLIGSATDALIAAPAIDGKKVFGFGLRGIAILGDLESSEILIGADLGADGQPGGAGADADSYSAGSLGTLLIAGSMKGSHVRVGQDPADGIFDNGNDLFYGDANSNIRSITIFDKLSGDSSFVAGAFPDKAFVDWHKIRTATDPRFRLHETDVNQPPVSVDQTIAGIEDMPLAGTLLANDADGDTLTYSVVSAPAHGTVLITDPVTGEFSYVPDADSNGRDSFTFRASDGTALSDIATVTLDIAPVNDAPLLAPIGNQAVDEGELLAFTASVTDADLPLDALTFSLDSGAPSGASIDPVTGLFSWTPAESEGAGVYSITVRVTDQGSLSDFETIEVTVNDVNLAPTIADLAGATVDEMVLFTVDVDATDPDFPLNTLTYSLVEFPEGAEIDSATGVITWTPAETQDGAHQFHVKVTDNGTPAMSDTKEFTVTVLEVNREPVIAPINDQETDEMVLFTYDVDATDPDLPANTLTYSLDLAPTGTTIDSVSGLISWTPGEDQDGEHLFRVLVIDNGVPVLSDTEEFTVAVNEVNREPVIAPIDDQETDEMVLFTYDVDATDPDLPANTLTYSLDLAPEGADIDPVSGVITWTPAETQHGAHLFRVEVMDNGTPAMSDTEEFTVTVLEVNRAPTIDAVPDFDGDEAIDEMTLFTVDVDASDPDFPLNTLTYSLDLAPTGATIDSVSGLISWTPGEDQNGEHLFRVLVTDNGVPVLSDTEEFTVTVKEVNLAPELDLIGEQFVDEGALLTFTSSATDDDTPPNALTFSLVGAPAGAFMDGATGMFEWEPTFDQAGTYTFDVVVTDNGTPALSDSETITVTVSDARRVVFWDVDASGAWSDAENWSGDVLPTAEDIVVIDRPGDLTVTLDAGAFSAYSLNTDEDLVISGAGSSLRVANGATVSPEAAVAVVDGGSLTLDAGSFSALGSLAISGGGSANLNGTAMIINLSVAGGGAAGNVGGLGGSGAVTLIGGGTHGWSSGMLSDSGVLTVARGATLTVSGGDHLVNGKAIVNQGTVSWTAGADLEGTSTFANQGVFELRANSMEGTNTGEIDQQEAQTSTFGNGITVVNDGGLIDVQAGTLDLVGTLIQNGTVEVASGATLRRIGGFASAGLLAGSGTIDVGAAGEVTNTGTVAPGATSGDTTGTLTIVGNYAQGDSGLLSIELTAGGFDALAVSGAVTIASNTALSAVVDGFMPAAGERFQFMTFASRSGFFGSAVLPADFIVDEADAADLELVYAPIASGAPMLAASSAEGGLKGVPLDESRLESMVDAGIALWAEALGLDSAGVEALDAVPVVIADLPDTVLASTDGGTIFIDVDAAGHGWFVDLTSFDSAAFSVELEADVFAATLDSAAFGAMDLLTVVSHEIGHLLGFEHEDGPAVMRETLNPGVRYSVNWNAPVSFGTTPARPSQENIVEFLPPLEAVPAA
jgi:Bacterial Ig domain/CARDB/Putative Ig domain